MLQGFPKVSIPYICSQIASKHPFHHKTLSTTKPPHPHLSTAPKTTPATTSGLATNPQCPTSLSTTSHCTPEPSMKACATSGVNVASSIALSQILRPSSARSAQRGGSTGVVMTFSACGRAVFARASCSDGEASLKRWGMAGSKTKRPGAGFGGIVLLVLRAYHTLREARGNTVSALTKGGHAPPMKVNWSTPAGTGAQLM